MPNPNLGSPLKFSVQREDPRLEEHLLSWIPGDEKRLFAISAGGCTLLQLAARRDVAELIGADIDAAQTSWTRFKLAAAKHLSRRDFCRATGISQFDAPSRANLLAKVVEHLDEPDRAYFKENRGFFAAGAFDAGTFERLFAGWRHFVESFVMPREELAALFDSPSVELGRLLGSELWPISFDLFFHQNLLTALFGPEALQHAPPGSFPRYFQARFEMALRRLDRASNPYLSHIVRGRYGQLDAELSLPDYLLHARYDALAQNVSKVRCFTGSVAQILTEHPGPYHLIQLSNILDWSDERGAEELAEPVLANLAPGGMLLVRQLNNVRPLPRLWTSQLDFDPALERELGAMDRSFFYSAIRVGKRA